MKSCRVCKIEKDITEFPINKECKDGTRNTCKKCVTDKSRLYYWQNKEQRQIWAKEYYLKNSEQTKARAAEYYEKNKNHCIKRNKAYAEKNSEKLKNARKIWVEENREKLNAYFSDRRKNDLQFRIAGNLRNRLNKFFKRTHKSLCYLFVPGMTKENYGQWQIDHIIPLSYFDLSKDKNRFLAGHYLNLRPMWAEENISKHDDLPPNLNELISKIESVIGIPL